MNDLRYQSGFGNEHATEAVPGALPQGRNSPQKAPFALYPELVSGTAYLFRPDQHVCARWRSPTLAGVQAALKRATAC